MYKLINERLELLNSLIRNEIFLEIAPKTKLADMLNFEKEFNDKRIELLNSFVGSPFLVQFKNRLFFIFFNYLFFYDLKELSVAKA